VNSEGVSRRQLSLQGGTNARGTDVVRVHFLPKTSLSERANDPELIPPEEKDKIRKDCIQGFLSLASGLANHSVLINNHNNGDDYYLYADTNVGMALFLINSCGFRGN